MSLYEIISLAVWTVSSLAVIVSLYQVNRQTRIFARQTEYVANSLTETRMESLANQSRDITRLFLDYPELRPYFYYHQDIDENNPHFHRAEVVAELILDIFWTMERQAARTDTSSINISGGKEMWDDFVQDSFALSPIMVRTLMKREAWYGPDMVAQMKAGLKRHAAGPHAESHH